MPKEKQRENKTLLCVLLVLWGIIILLQFTAREINGFAQWYGVHIYPFFVQTVGRFCNLFPFSVVEFALYGVSVYVFGRIGYCIWASWKKKNGKLHWLRFLRFVVVFISWVVLVFTLTCGINYFRKPFSEVSGFSIGEHNVKELWELCVYLTEEINEASEQLERDENGIAINQDNLHEEAIVAMKNLAQWYPSLSGYYPEPKPVTFSEILTYQYIMGIYSPFTLEANYNQDMLDFEVPYSICHELSHLKGFMREDEAGFIAYLACRYSDNVFFQYSGAMEAFSYAMGVYYKVAGYEAYCEVYELLNDEVILEQQAKNLWWAQHETFIQTVSAQVNDVYLKVNAQEDGIQSYGRMVDLLLEEYLKNKETEG